ncbi:LOW QUALITY PROTEIN: hypothetical protein CFOL_v3_19851, partial [Cephalotus follicularis]
QVFAKGVDPDSVVMMAARASRTENQDDIDTAIVGMLADPKEARAGIQEVHFLPFNPTDKRTTLTYIDGDGKMHRVSKGAPEKILLTTFLVCSCSLNRVHAVIDKFAVRGLRSLAVAYQEVPEGTKDSPGDRLAIGKETGRHLGMGTNMYPSSALLGQVKDESIVALPIDELIEKANGFVGVFPDLIIMCIVSKHKYEIVKRLQARKHICGMTGDG